MGEKLRAIIAAAISAYLEDEAWVEEQMRARAVHSPWKMAARRQLGRHRAAAISNNRWAGLATWRNQ